MASHPAAPSRAQVRVNMARLSPTQADGLACVVCDADYLAVKVPHRPVGRSLTGSQIFACSTTCMAPGGAA
jgi:hypothetical protein